MHDNPDSISEQEIISLEMKHAQEQIFEANQIDELISLAMEFAVDDYDSLALDALHKAMSLSKYSSDLCEIAIAIYELKLPADTIERCLTMARNQAKLPSDLDEIARTEAQLKEERYSDECL